MEDDRFNQEQRLPLWDKRIDAFPLDFVHQLESTKSEHLYHALVGSHRLAYPRASTCRCR
eukprot:1158164-Pelagomonas_calceolata.AAC.2